ncbi:uncharacterized protein LOC112452813 [Temnothorax curvispinosus]|uniref:Uncharacterized protein LOC112452813 n=1 Tax=Temnothorax curvispinosus TaxID=300111 RepID=A0A6J1PHF2_9HYME|nr:uncharacterized protein LOC112452813 [Temnothorax curvispinosus]
MYHTKNLVIIINILLNNGYPLELIFRKVRLRLKYLHNNKLGHTDEIESVSQHSDDALQSKKFIAIPFIKNISNKVAHLLSNDELMVGYRVLNNLGRFVKAQKDKNPGSSNNNVIYKISCKDCSASYVGQTKRQFKTRLNEHKNNIKTVPSRHSVISEHITKFNHTFDWDNTAILESEPNYKRLISEMLHIKEQKNGINSNTDTDYLDDSYFSVLDELANNKNFN